jgi:RNA polymerase sigma-70 factor (ECF subfamily)
MPDRQARAELRRLRRALDTMPAQARAVFDRHRFRSMAYPEIAEELGIDAEEVERHMAQAMAHLLREANKRVPGRSERIWAWLRAALRRVWRL